MECLGLLVLKALLLTIIQLILKTCLEIVTLASLSVPVSIDLLFCGCSYNLVFQEVIYKGDNRHPYPIL